MDHEAPSCRDALESALRTKGIPPGCEALVALARRLADEIDCTGDADAVARLALRHLATLKALGLAEGIAAPERSFDSPLDELRARREAG